jgi:prepilin signal peptidase PulO-like enzyme (type II secretory pathway)
MLAFKARHELPFGPYLSMASVIVMLFYFPIYDYWRPGILGLEYLLWSWL